MPRTEGNEREHAGTWNVIAYRDAPFQRTLTWCNPDGSPRNLTGYTSEEVIMPDYGETAIATWTTSNHIALNAAAGMTTYNTPTATMRALAAGTWVHQTRLINGSGDSAPGDILRGTFIIRDGKP